MKFIEKNMGKDVKVLYKAHYDRIILAPFIAMGVLIALAGYLLKKIAPYLLAGLMGIPELNMSEELYGALGTAVFYIFLIGGVIYTVINIIRTTGIELAVTDSLLIGRYGTDAMCVPLEKVENIAIFKNIIGEIFKFGTITVGTPSITLKFPFIADPEKFKEKVLELQKQRMS